MEATSNGKPCNDAREWVDAYIDAFIKLAKSSQEPPTTRTPPAGDADRRERCAPR